MADIPKLKKKAAECEAKGQTERALDVYREIIRAYEDGSEDPIDIPLYNRVGDLLLKAGHLAEAVSVWEKAVDHYTEGGFFNPAIAMCNKILRASPGRTAIHHKLGRIHAQKGFKGDARRHFLEYASRQQKAGNLDEAFRALKEFAELVPDQYDVRLMLADQLVHASRTDEAIAELQLGYTRATADGDARAASDFSAKMQAIDPGVEPVAVNPTESEGGGGLVFLDLDDGVARPPAAVMVAPEPVHTLARRRQDAEALLEQGDRDTAIHELDAAMAGFEEEGDLDTAGSIAEELVRLEPTSIRHHQKRVEFAVRANDRPRAIEAYGHLADTLLAAGQVLKARAVYRRILDLDPDNLHAEAALEAIPNAATHQQADEQGYISLGEWLREAEEPRSTRLVLAEQEPSGDEAADFADMLRKFRQGVSNHLTDHDHEAHYDLGVAFREMGLLDEAIAEFQKALQGTTERPRTFEALGQCFVEKGRLPVAATILQRALAEPGVRDENLVEVRYLLGAICEAQQQWTDAKHHYERVFAVDIRFRDVEDRLNAVEQRLS